MAYYFSNHSLIYPNRMHAALKQRSFPTCIPYDMVHSYNKYMQDKHLMILPQFSYLIVRQTLECAKDNLVPH